MNPQISSFVLAAYRDFWWLKPIYVVVFSHWVQSHLFIAFNGIYNVPRCLLITKLDCSKNPFFIFISILQMRGEKSLREWVNWSRLPGFQFRLMGNEFLYLSIILLSPVLCFSLTQQFFLRGRLLMQLVTFWCLIIFCIVGGVLAIKNKE